MEQPARYGWTKSAIRMAADIANEKGVTVKLERDGSITISPADLSAADEMRAYIESKKIPEAW